MGSSLADVHAEYTSLWNLAALYFVTACFSLRFIKRYKVFNAI
jgi:hypothetical protein